MNFVFVSHAAPDKLTRVKPLVQALALEGVTLWLDRPGSGEHDFQLSEDFIRDHGVQRLHNGLPWSAGIVEALRDSSTVLICLSRAAIEPEREVLRQEIFAAVFDDKAVSCVVDDLDLQQVPGNWGLVRPGHLQSPRVDVVALADAVAWLEANPGSRPDALPAAWRGAWQTVRQLRDDLDAATRRGMTLARSRQQWPYEPRASYVWPTPWDFSAYMAEKREIFEGRDWLFADIAAWQAAGHPHALIVRADYGVGKSAITSELVHRNSGGTIVAWHFCQHDTQETLQPGAFVRSLAAQLAAALPCYRELVEADQALQERLDRALLDPGSALEGAVLAPLARIPPPDGPRLMVIDALDEALELDTDLTPRGGTIVSLLAGRAGRFPPWLLVLATSRPNPQVLVALQAAFGVLQIDAERADNQDDLRRYILGRAKREPLAARLRASGVAAEALAGLLTERSQGKFLYAVRAMRDIELDHIGVAELAALPPGMDSFYLDAFERRFARAGRDYEPVRAVLGVLAAAREPVPPEILAEVSGINTAQVKTVQAVLPDFLRRRAGKLTFDHFSLTEWLTRENAEGFARAGTYAVNVEESQQRWHSWAVGQVQSGRAQTSAYLLRHLAAHLRDDEERRDVFGQLMLTSFDWLQARLEQDGVDALLADTRYIGLPDQPILQAVLRNSAHVLRQHPELLAGQVLGRVGCGLGSAHHMAGLAEATRQWLRSSGGHQGAPLLVPTSRSLRLSAANVATLTPGGHVLIVLRDGRVVSGGSDKTVRVWDPKRGGEPVVFEGHSGVVDALAVLPDGRIVSGGHDRTVRVWDPQHGGEPVVFEGHSDGVNALAVLPDGRLVSGSNDRTVRVWDPQRGGEPVVFEGHSGGDKALAVLPDGRIVSGGHDRTVRVWDPQRGGEPVVFEGHSAWVTALAVLPDGRIVSGSNDRTVRVWDLQRGGEPVVFEGHSAWVTALAVLPDGRIVSGSDDRTVRVWDPQRGGEPVVFEGHSGRVAALEVLPDGRIVSGAVDRTLCVWHPSCHRHFSLFVADADVSCIALAVGRLIVAGCADGAVHFLREFGNSAP